MKLPAAALVALACLGGSLAQAGSDGVPSWPNSTVPDGIFLVGLGPAGPDSATGHFEIVVRDWVNQPVGYVTVILEFAGAGDYLIATDQMDPRLHVRCDHRTVYTVSDGAGVARFTIVGAARYPPPFPGSNNVVGVSIDGSSFGSTRCRSFDLNGTGGVSLPDVSVWGSDFFGDLHPTRSDFDSDGRVTLLDLARWVKAYLEGASFNSAPAYCP